MSDDSEFDDEDWPLPIVLDIGSSKISSGFSGSESPRSIVPNIVGRPKFQAALFGSDTFGKRVCDMARPLTQLV